MVESNLCEVGAGACAVADGPTDARAASRAALERAIAVAGSENELARRLPGKLGRGHLYYWRNRAKRGVPAEHCAAVAAAVGHAVTERELRGDLFGAAVTDGTKSHG